MMTVMQGRFSKPFLPRPGPTESSISRHQPEGNHGQWFSHQTLLAKVRQRRQGKVGRSCVSCSSSTLFVSWQSSWGSGMAVCRERTTGERSGESRMAVGSSRTIRARTL